MRSHAKESDSADSRSERSKRSGSERSGSERNGSEQDGTTHSTTAQSITAQRGTVLDVPFAEKDQAKNVGARWDPDMRKWFVPRGLDVRKFDRWITANAPQHGIYKNRH